MESCQEFNQEIGISSSLTRGVWDERAHLGFAGDCHRGRVGAGDRDRADRPSHPLRGRLRTVHRVLVAGLPLVARLPSSPARRPWLWAGAVGPWFPAMSLVLQVLGLPAPIQPNSVTTSLILVPISLAVCAVGAYAGALARRIILPPSRAAGGFPNPVG